MSAGKRLPQPLDRLGEAGYLFGQSFGLRLLGRESALGRLQLILEHLQLVDRFLLGRLQALGVLDKLLGYLRADPAGRYERTSMRAPEATTLKP